MTWLRLLLIVGLALPALACAAMSVLAQGGRISARLDVLTHAAPIYLGVGVVTFVLGLALGRSGFAWVSAPAVVAILGAALLMAPEFMDRRPPAAAGARLTIVQFNAWGGNTSGEAAAAWILAQRPDIVVLEEGGRVGPHLLAAGGFEVICPQGYATIYTRLPVLAQDCPESPGEPKALVSSVKLAGPAGPFSLFGVHRPWPVRLARDAGQSALLHRMVLGQQPERTLLVGDFNSTPWSFARRREDVRLGLIRRTRALFTWPAERVSHNPLPAWFAVFPIDHIYAGPGWDTVEVRRGPRLGSDHYPVVAVLSAR